MARRTAVVVVVAGMLALVGLPVGSAGAAVGAVSPAFVPAPPLPPVVAGAVPTAGRRLPRLHCTAWTFVPLHRTTCRKGTVDHPRVRRVGDTWFTFAKARGSWQAIPYTWNRQRHRLELDATRVTVRQPAPRTAASVWRWTCSRWALVSEAGPTDCTRGRAQRVTARFKVGGGPAWIRDRSTGAYERSTYRWNPRGGYLALDATLVPAASVDLGAQMRPRPSESVSDYLVSCAHGSVTAAVVARAGGRVVFDGRSVTATTTRTVPLEPGQAVRWTLKLPGHKAVLQQARCRPEDLPRWSSTGKGGPAGHWFLMTPTFALPGKPTPTTQYVVVADSHGTPVWWRATSTYTPIDAKVLPSGALAVGETGVTFSQTSRYHTSDWVGNDGPVIGAGLGLDHHDLWPTADGNYLGIRYVYRDCLGAAADCVDMTAYGGSAAATVIDGEIVKFSPDGTVLWTWRARDHIGADEWVAPARLDINGHDYWDIDHINSVDDDGDGVIVSIRQLDAIYRIRLSDGAIDWKLSGTTTPQSLTVPGVTGHLTVGQHDAHRNAAGNLLVFDNGTFESRAPRALEIRIDDTTRTASVVRQVSDPRVPSSVCCGSAREVATGTWLIAWGGTPWVTEVGPDGKPVLSLKMSAAFSYRATPVPTGAVTRSDLVAGMDAMHPRPG